MEDHFLVMNEFLLAHGLIRSTGMSFKSFFFAVFIASIFIYQIEAKGNVCSTEDSTGLDTEAIFAKYLGKPKLFTAYLTRFRSHPYLEDFYKHIEDDASSTNPAISLLALETALMSSDFLGNKVNNTCDLSLVVNLAVEYEKTGDIDTLICAIDYLRATSSTSMDREVEFFLQEVGCGSYYDRPETVSPTCGNKKCVSNGHPTDWRDTFKYIVNHKKNDHVPANIGIYDSLDRIFNTNDKNLWGVALTWYIVELHTAWLYHAGINEDPKVLGLAMGVLHYMELIGYSKECSCEDRVRLVTAAQDGVNNAVTVEINYLKSTLRKKFRKR